MKSIIKSKKPVQWGKTIVIEELHANEAHIKAFQENLKSNRPDITNEEIDKEVQNMIMKDNYYNKVMDEIAGAYEIEFSKEEIDEIIGKLKILNENAPAEQLELHAKIQIIKQIVYDDLAEQWGIIVNDEIAKKTLEDFYKKTGNPIREYLTDREKFEDIKKTIFEQTITTRILNAFNGEFRVAKNEKS